MSSVNLRSLTDYVILDASPLGRAVSPRMAPQFSEWLRRAAAATALAVPEIVDYEVRRELLRGGLELSVQRLDALLRAVTYLPISTSIMRSAAELWADARNRGRPTADRHALDADVILAATALEEARYGHEVVVATDNVRHLRALVDARHWSDIEFN